MSNSDTSTPASALAHETITSRITDVTVFRKGAIVRREAELPSGQNRFVFRELPTTLRDGTVRLSVIDHPSVAPIDVEVSVAYSARSEADLSPLEQREQDARRLVRAYQQERERLLAHMQWLERVQLELNDDDSEAGTTPVATWLDAVGWLGKEREARLPRLLELDDAISNAEKEADAAAHQLQLGRQSALREATRVYKQVSFSLNTPQAAGVKVRLEYQVPGARWAPTYTARLGPSGNNLTLQLAARVAQRTQEVWQDVRLTVSTAELADVRTLQKLKSLRVGRANNELPVYERAPLSGNGALFADYQAWLARTAKPTASESRAWPLNQTTAIGSLLGEAGRGGAGRPKPSKQAKVETSMPYPSPPPPAPMPYPSPPGGAPVMAAMAAPMMATARTGAPMAERDVEPERKLKKSMARRSLQREESAKESSAEFLGGAPAMDSAPSEVGDMPTSAYPDSEESSFGEEAAPAKRSPAFELLCMNDANSHDRGKLRRRPAANFDQINDDLRSAHELDEYSEVAVMFESVPRDARFDHAYQSTTLAMVRPDGEPQLVPLLSKTTDIELQHIVVPRVSSEAVREARFNNPFDQPLLFGPCEVYLGDEFLVTSSIYTTVSGGSIELGLGIDEGLKVARNAFYEEEKGGILKGSLALHHRVEIELASRIHSRTTVLVRESIPSVGNGKEEPVVELGKVEPAWITLNEELGHYAYKVELQPGDKRTLRHHYTIKIKSDEELVGGNRRERA